MEEIEKIKEELLILNLLRQIFLKEPEIGFLEEFAKIEPPMEEKGTADGLKVMVDSVSKNEHRLGQWAEELSIEYARLFLGPINPPAIPFASFYLSPTGSLMTQETLEVRKRYLAVGLAPKDIYQIPDDHISLELEYIYYLSREALHLMEAGCYGGAQKFLNMRQEFLKEHMTLWIPVFTEKIIESAQEDFFKGAALLLKELIYSI